MFRKCVKMDKSVRSKKQKKTKKYALLKKIALTKLYAAMRALITPVSFYLYVSFDVPTEAEVRKD